MKPKKPLNKFWNRNPFFYKMRFRLLLTEIDDSELLDLCYNNTNKINSIPEIYFEVNKKIFEKEFECVSDFDKAITIAKWLRNNIKGGKGLGISSDKALQYMLSGGYGICSDFSQIFNNFCVINNIKTREWGLNNNNFDGDGHSYNEFYSKGHNQWILIDISKSVYFISQEKNMYNKMLSVKEVFTFSKFQLNKKIVFFNSDYKPNLKVLNRYYNTKNAQPFLVDNYDNKLYDFLMKKLSFLPIPFIHGFAIILNKSYKYKKLKLVCEHEKIS
jgi:hypothetical protein